MKVCINGLRQNATNDLNNLGEVINRHVFSGGNYIDDWERQEIAEAFNELAQAVGMFNCIYSKELEGFDDLSEELTVNFMEVE